MDPYSRLKIKVPVNFADASEGYVSVPLRIGIQAANDYIQRSGREIRKLRAAQTKTNARLLAIECFCFGLFFGWIIGRIR